MRISVAAVFAVALSGAATAQQEDPTSIENYQLVEDGQQLPTASSVAAIRERAIAAMDDGECEAAIPMLQEWARQANMSANLLRRGLQPFYKASRDDSSKFAGSDRPTFQTLINAEERANGYTGDRNEAWVREAECLLDIGDTSAAGTAAYRALDYLSIKETELWETARNIVWQIVEYEQ